MFQHDPEVPRGHQDADLLQAQYEAESAAYRREIARGTCLHSWQLGHRIPAYYTADDIAHMRSQGEFPDRATDERVGDQASIPAECCLCLDCGRIVERPFDD